MAYWNKGAWFKLSLAIVFLFLLTSLKHILVFFKVKPRLTFISEKNELNFGALNTTCTVDLLRSHVMVYLYLYSLISVYLQYTVENRHEITDKNKATCASLKFSIDK